MGWLRKLTGVQAQIDTAAANTAATVEATKQASIDAQATLNAQARAAADQISLQSARETAMQTAADAANRPIESATVLLDDPVARPTKKTRAAFGRGTSAVSI